MNIESIINRLKQEENICAAFLHGSASKKTMRPDSDIDIALLPFLNTRIDASTRLELAGELESTLHRPVDLGILSINNLVYAKEVIHHGELLFSKDQQQSDQFSMNCLSMYADLQENRKEVLHAYSA